MYDVHLPKGKLCQNLDKFCHLFLDTWPLRAISLYGRYRGLIGEYTLLGDNDLIQAWLYAEISLALGPMQIKWEASIILKTHDNDTSMPWINLVELHMA